LSPFWWVTCVLPVKGAIFRLGRISQAPCQRGNHSKGRICGVLWNSARTGVGHELPVGKNEKAGDGAPAFS
jgi:hypothetical protein